MALFLLLQLGLVSLLLLGDGLVVPVSALLNEPCLLFGQPLPLSHPFLPLFTQLCLQLVVTAFQLLHPPLMLLLQAAELAVRTAQLGLSQRDGLLQPDDLVALEGRRGGRVGPA